MPSQIIDISKSCLPIKEAVKHYPTLEQYVDDKHRLDLGNTNALRTYNKAIAKVFLGLEIEVPPDHLIPTMCLRYFMVKLVMERYEVKSMLEIGTGASAIISLISAKHHNINCVSTEINPKSIQYARLNIQRNKLEKKIQLIQSHGGIINGVVEGAFDLLLSYPPVYPDGDSVKFTGDSRNKRGFQGSKSEMIGGGIHGFLFTEKLIHEAMHANIKVIGILLIKKEQVEMAINLLTEYEQSIFEIITIKAGRRTRYLVLINKYSISD